MMKLALVYLAALGFLVSAFAHVFSIFGLVPGGKRLFFTYFAGVFPVFIPTVFALRKRFPEASTKFRWADALRWCPAPIRVLFYATFIYAIGSFLFLWSQGTKMRQSTGEVLSAETARAFSGHAMAFYMTTAAVMLSLHREEKGTKHPFRDSQRALP